MGVSTFIKRPRISQQPLNTHLTVIKSNIGYTRPKVGPYNGTKHMSMNMNGNMHRNSLLRGAFEVRGKRTKVKSVTHMCAHTRARTHTHTHVHTHAHAHTHTHTYEPRA